MSCFTRSFVSQLPLLFLLGCVGEADSSRADGGTGTNPDGGIEADATPDATTNPPDAAATDAGGMDASSPVDAGATVRPDAALMTGYPNRPPSYTNVITDYGFDVDMPPGREVPVSDGWSTAWNDRGLMRRISDPTAPQSPPNVLEWFYSLAGTRGGGGVGILYRLLTPAPNQIYVAMRIKHDANFEWNAISNKLLYLEPGNIILQSRHYDEYMSVWVGGISQNLSPTNNRTIPLDEWVFIEYLVDAVNGQVKVWTDGVLTLDRAASVPGGWASLKLDSTWGGGGTKTRDSYRWLDHIFVATP